PDGARLITAHSDGTALVWNVRALADRPLSARTWDDLGSEDARTGFAAVCALAAQPAKAVELIGKNLRPAAVEAKQVRRWLAERAAEDFGPREAAQAKLRALGAGVEGDLRQALEREKDAEARRRLEKLLAALPSPLRQTRALEVLEGAGTPEAAA